MKRRHAAAPRAISAAPANGQPTPGTGTARMDKAVAVVHAQAATNADQQQPQEQQQHLERTSSADQRMEAEEDTTSMAALLTPDISTEETPPSTERPLIKMRRTKNYKWREDMANRPRDVVIVRMPPLEPTTFASWSDFHRAWTAYMTQTKTLYRRRSSCSTASWNSKRRYKGTPVPERFQYATMAYWCTHGCIQPSRGTGVRAHLHQRFTGCTARITAEVVHESSAENDDRWFIRVRNQISQHNHRVNDEIHNCYSNNSAVPDELLLGELSQPSQPSQATPQPLLPHASQTYPVTPRGLRAAGAEATGDASMVGSSQAVSESSSTNGAIPGTGPGTAALLREVLEDEKKVGMAQGELKPLLDVLRHTPSRVIHKRLQDVSEVVIHLLAKWHHDQAEENRTLQAEPRLLMGERRSSTRILPAVTGADGHVGGSGANEDHVAQLENDHDNEAQQQELPTQPQLQSHQLSRGGTRNLHTEVI